MSLDLTPLKTEIAKPQYAGLTDDQITALMNALGPTVTLPAIPKNDWLEATLPAAIRCSLSLGTDGQALAPNVTAKWQTVIDHVRAADPGSNIDLTILTNDLSILGNPVTDRVMSSAEFTAMTTLQVTLVQSLLGFGVVCSDQLLAEARQS